jgi:hypothetical protein
MLCFRQWISPVAGEGLEDGKEKPMSNNHENRVLTRRGARQLTSDELEQITAAGGPFTRASLTGTGTMLSTDSDMDS